MFLNGGSGALADICSFPVITDPAAANAPPAIEITDRGQLFEEADRSEDGFADVARTFNPAPVPRITDGPAFEFYEGERLFGLVQDVIATFKPTADPRTTDGPFTFGMNDIDRIVESFDDAGWFGFFDGLGTLATLTDPRAGGGALAVRINYRGEIVGTFDGLIGGPEWLAHTAPSAVPEEPSGWPLLAGSLLAVVMVARRRLRKHTPHVRRRRATRLPAWMRALRPIQ